MATRAERLAANEARFREINEAAEDRRRQTGKGRYVCECASSGCVSWIDVDSAEYGRIHSNARHFIVRPAHERPDIERVVERSDDYLVVEKPEEVAHVVERDV